LCHLFDLARNGAKGEAIEDVNSLLAIRKIRPGKSLRPIVPQVLIVRTRLHFENALLERLGTPRTRRVVIGLSDRQRSDREAGGQ
jgi:hypothetical protein